MHFHLTLIRPFQIPPYLSIMLLTDDKPQEYSSRKLKSHNVTSGGGEMSSHLETFGLRRFLWWLNIVFGSLTVVEKS